MESLRRKLHSLREMKSLISDSDKRTSNTFALQIKSSSAENPKGVAVTLPLDKSLDLDFLVGTLNREIGKLDKELSSIEASYKKLLHEVTT